MELGDQRGVKTGRWLVNEILHADDINFLSQAQYQAVTEILSLLAKQGVASGSTADIVLAGLLLEHSALLTCNLRTGVAVSFSGAYWNAEQWGFVASAGRIFSLLVPEDTPIAFDTGGSQDRIDTLEARPARIAYDAVTRQFKDPVTGQVTSSVTNTKYEFGFEFQILKGDEGGSPVAPTHTAGWIKVAEVEIDGSATSIVQADIKDVRDSDLWTTEADDTEYKEPFIGEKVTSSPTGGTATLLDKESTVGEALTEVFARLINLSGVGNAAVLARHLATDAVETAKVKAQNITLPKLARGADNTYLQGKGAGADPAYAASMPPLTTEGDLIVQGGALPERLAGGGAGFYLQSQGAGAIPIYKQTMPPLTTKGDLIIQNTTNPARLAAAALDTYLKAQGAGNLPIYEKMALRDTGVKIGISSRSSSGDQVISGVGFQPSVVVFVTVDGTPSNNNLCWGFDDGTAHMSIRIQDNFSQSLESNSQSFFIRRDADNYIVGYISALGSGGFTITWALTGTCACEFIYLALP